MRPFRRTILAQSGFRRRLCRVCGTDTGEQGRKSGLEDWPKHGCAGIGNGKSRLGDAPESSPDHRVREVGEIDRGEHTDADDGDRGNTVILVRAVGSLVGKGNGG
jgi:hypothetical protein